MNDTKKKGNIAQQKVILKAIEKDWVVSKPIDECRYDLILDDGAKIYRTQVKYCNRHTSHVEGSVFITCNNGPRCPKFYGHEIDLMLVYLPEIDKIVKLNPSDFVGKATITIRLYPTKNGQKKNVFFAEEKVW